MVNAGGPPPGKFMEFTDENWQAAFDMNLMSAVRMIREVIPSMESRGGGSILTVTSSSVKEPIDVLILSNVMRSGVTSLVKSLSLQLAPKNIRVNNLMPGRIDTDRVRSIDENQAKAAGISVEDRKAQIRFLFKDMEPSKTSERWELFYFQRLPPTSQEVASQLMAGQSKPSGKI